MLIKPKQEVCIEAINLRTYKLNGYKLLSVYSKEYGLLKLTGRKLGGRSEPFVHNNFWISFGREDIHKIIQSEFLGHFNKLSSKLERMTWAWQYADFLEACASTQDEKSQEIFALFFNSLRELEETENSFLEITLRFLWDLSNYLGYKPSLRLCNLNKFDCHLFKSLETEAWFDFEAGGILCESCTKNHEKRSEAAIRVLPGIYKILQALEQKESLDNSKAAQFVLSLMQRHLQKHTHRKLKSLQILSELNA